MDPQQRLLLEEAYRAVEDSGRAPDSLAGTSVGIFVGARSGDYGDQVFATDGPSSHVLLGNDMAVLSSGQLARCYGSLPDHRCCLRLVTGGAASRLGQHSSWRVRVGDCRWRLRRLTALLVHGLGGGSPIDQWAVSSLQRGGRRDGAR